MKKEEFLEKLESLLEFNHKSKFIMYSHDLMVISSDLFFNFCVTDNSIRGWIPYGDILDVSLENDINEGVYLNLHRMDGDLYIAASGFDIKTGAATHSVDLYHPFKRAWLVQELKENRALVVFATYKQEAVFIALSILGFDANDIIDNRIPYMVDTLPALDAWGDVWDKNYLDPANKDDWEILKNYSFFYDDEDHIRYSFRDQAEKKETP